MMNTREINDRMQMEKRKDMTRFYLDISNNAEDNLLKAKEILEDVEAKGALIKDAVVYFINSKDFNLEKYEGPGHRKNRMKAE